MASSKTKFLVINLDSATDRLTFMTDQFRKFGIPAERVAAIDAAQGRRGLAEEIHPDAEWLIAPEKRIRFINDHAAVASPLLGRWITAGEIACYLSHYQAISQFLDSDADFACILEDDVRLSEEFIETIKFLEQRAPNAIVKLEGIRRYRIDIRWPVLLSRGRRIVFRFKPTTGAAAYFLTRSVAANLRRSLIPIREPYDSWLRQYWRHLIPVYETEPFVAHQDSQFNSSISSRDRQPEISIRAEFKRFMGGIKFWFKTERVLRRMFFFLSLPVFGRFRR